MISFSSTPGNLFNRWGSLASLLTPMRAYQASQLTNTIDPTYGVTPQFNLDPDIQAVMGSSYLGILSGPEGISSIIQNMAQQSATRAVYHDNPLPGQTLQSGNVQACIVEIIRQMGLAGATILAMTVGGTVSGFTGLGNGAVVFSGRRPFDGRMLENSYAEQVLLICTGDSYSGSATAGNEPFSVAGAGSTGDLFAYNWPQGSGASTSVNAIDGDSDASDGNVLTNSGFASWTANVPDNFSLTVGTAGTNVQQETGITYSGGSSLKLIGDGTTQTALTQLFNDATGTIINPSQQTQYSFSVWLRTDASPPAAGVMTVELVDGAGVNVADAGGNPNSFTFNLTGLNTTFTPYTGVFRTPLFFPTDLYLRFRCSTALNNGAAVYMGKMGMGVMTQLYTSGPFFSVHSGSVPFLNGDFATVQVSNGRGAGGTLDTFQTALYIICDPFIASTGFLFPSSATPTISDSLIT